MSSDKNNKGEAYGAHRIEDTLMSNTDTSNAPSTKEEERNSFLFLAVLLAPILSFTLIGGYGFAVWVMQMIFGPPMS